MEKIKEFLGNINSRTKKIILAGVVGVFVVAGSVIIALSMRENLMK